MWSCARQLWLWSRTADHYHSCACPAERKRSAAEVENQEAEEAAAKRLKTGEGEQQEAEGASAKRPRTDELETEEAEDAPAKRLKPAD